MTTVTTETPGRAGRRVSWTVGDQLLSSLTNLGLALLVARELDADDFGSFTLVYGCYVFAVGVSKALTSEPLLVRHTADSPQARIKAIAESSGAALVIGVVIGVVFLVVASFTSGSGSTAV